MKNEDLVSGASDHSQTAISKDSSRSAVPRPMLSRVAIERVTKWASDGRDFLSSQTVGDLIQHIRSQQQYLDDVASIADLGSASEFGDAPDRINAISFLLRPITQPPASASELATDDSLDVERVIRILGPEQVGDLAHHAIGVWQAFEDSGLFSRTVAHKAVEDAQTIAQLADGIQRSGLTSEQHSTSGVLANPERDKSPRPETESSKPSSWDFCKTCKRPQSCCVCDPDSSAYEPLARTIVEKGFGPLDSQEQRLSKQMNVVIDEIVEALKNKNPG